MKPRDNGFGSDLTQIVIDNLNIFASVIFTVMVTHFAREFKKDGIVEVEA